MSTQDDRLLVIYTAYSRAYDRRATDWSQASTPEQAQAIADNVDKLESEYLRAARHALDANGATVEAAFNSAVAAQQDIEAAYDAAKSIAEKIRLVGRIVGKVGDLIDKARPG